MPLTGPQLGRIHQAIVAAFDRAEFTRTLLTRMDVDFDQAVAPDDFSAQAFELVRWADRQKRALELVNCLRDERPADADLADLHDEAQGWAARAAAAPAPVAPAAPAPAAEPAHAPPQRRGGRIVPALAAAAALLAVALLALGPLRAWIAPPATPQPSPGAPPTVTPSATPTATSTATPSPPAPAAAAGADPTLIALFGQWMALMSATQAAATATPSATPSATPATPPTATDAGAAAEAAAAGASATPTPTPTGTPGGTSPGRPPVQSAGLAASLWPPGQTLRVRFLGGDPALHERIAAVAQEWTEYANLTFAFGDDPDAEIRVGFEPTGSWAYRGTSALHIPQDDPTINFGGLDADTDEATLRWVVLREFGHVLGLINEQLNPNADIPWDEAAVIAFYRENYAWAESDVRAQLLERYPPDVLTVPKPFDPASVMMMTVPNDLTVGDYEIAGRSSELSALDRRSVAAIYPHANGAGLKAALWQPGQTLRVRFLDGDPDVQQRVAAIAQEWTQYANLTLAFGDDPAAEIRISFAPGGSWSYVGAQAQMIPEDQPTMNFGWLTARTEEEEFRRVVLAEFGHALGMVNEHLQPNAAIPWDEAAVIAYFSGPPNYWSEEQIHSNLLNKYLPEDLAVPKPFDPRSVMMIPVDNALTAGDYEIPGRNSELSVIDQRAIAQLYPRDGPDNSPEAPSASTPLPP